MKKLISKFVNPVVAVKKYVTKDWKAIEEREALMVELSEFFKLKKVYFECLSEGELNSYVEFMKEYNSLEARVDFIEESIVN